MIINTLINDKSDQIFTSLNAGDIKTQFETRERYIDFIQSSNYLDFLMTKDIISVPGVLTQGGINLVVFHKKELLKYFLECSDKCYFSLSSSTALTIYNPFRYIRIHCTARIVVT